MIYANPDIGSEVSEAFGWAEGNRLVNAIGGEQWLADRVERERKSRGWSQVELSRKLAEAGHPLHQSAISKIESPPKVGARSITIDEAIGFSLVFGIPVGELLLPPEAAREAHVWKEFMRASELRVEMRRLENEHDDIVFGIKRALATTPNAAVRIAEYRSKTLREVEARISRLQENDGRNFQLADLDDYTMPPAVVTANEVLDGWKEPHE